MFKDGDIVKVRIVQGNYWIDTKHGRFMGYTKTGRVRVRLMFESKPKAFAAHNVTHEDSEKFPERTRKKVDYIDTVQNIKYEDNSKDRFDAGFKTTAHDCVCAAITTASGLDYIDVYNGLLKHTAADRRLYGRTGYHPAHKLKNRLYFNYIRDHMNYSKIRENIVRPFMNLQEFAMNFPKGRFMVVLDTHALALIDGVYYDRLTRCARYWKKEHTVRSFVKF